ncbi:mycofactocin biosynthesis chaperone MftB [Granulicoccus phenolivorans]|uniref:mycofactocin biosynthesis chaperone MftB n=1 Tax=Granulicoccus phenolivorans TaxID=266854 RepID=UPI00040825D4|nr:mycofactocin biosynthesis chaperone MftB [Granulicoccus phenolivorans]
MSTDTHHTPPTGAGESAHSSAPAGRPAPQPRRVGLDEAWELHPSVSIRPEPFGALVYHFGNRRLSFLKRPELLTVVQELAGAVNVAAALDAAAVPAEDRPIYTRALSTLAAGDMIRPRA